MSKCRALSTVDEEAPEPLTVKRIRTPRSRSQSFSSSASFPWIPRRHSSLAASGSDDSIEPATSTRTPSLSDSLYRIEVIKVRQSSAHPVMSDNSDSVEDPFVDKVVISQLH
ncbi:uncharacterized protein N7459_007592 [Penicillium hispanicum]|uniref:uncharacterized protein n=1 Tax=Penicillium hispanicum TaxID=1080232 RepID=UPI0025401F1F|nr:uncharacterized protein N7459_007592 [Penicillium hispanicum]KAJ5578628.1 hypothetical protein N7459_007592 [Penicillium hispanicum]